MSFKKNRLFVSIPIIGYSLISLYIISTAFLTGLKSNSEFIKNPIGFPVKWHLFNFVEAWKKADFSIYFSNSVIVTFFSLLGIVTVGCLAAYGLARYKFKISNMIFVYFMLGLMFPLQLYILPLFIIERNLGLLNSHLGLIITYTATAQSFSIFLLTGFFKTLSVEIEEAAKLDGAGDFRIFLRIMLPLSLPIVVTVLILNLISVWNDLFLPLVFIQDNLLRTIPLGLIYFSGQSNNNWTLLMAALAITILPIAVIYMFSAKAFINGLAAGAIK